MEYFREHIFYDEFAGLIKDDKDFAEMYDDTEDDFLAWVLDYEIDKDWQEG